MNRAPVRLNAAEIRYIISLLPSKTLDPLPAKSIKSTLSIRMLKTTTSAMKIT